MGHEHYLCPIDISGDMQADVFYAEEVFTAGQ
jgi:hypothetical protein